MKMNKKLLIPLFATVVGLSVVGGVSGAVAWYQFNTRVNASFVGTSVADSGVLQISSEEEGTYGRDVVKYDYAHPKKLSPVTFGYGDTVAGKGASLPAKAYCRPEAGVESMEQWSLATVNEEYVQFDLYLKAQKISGSSTTYTNSKVFLSEMFLDTADTGEYRTEITRALRVHLAVYEDISPNAPATRSFLISREGKAVNLHGNLDLDGDGELDKKSGWAWDESSSIGELIDYGKGHNAQESWAMTTSKTPEELSTSPEANLILAPRYNDDLVNKNEAEKPNGNLICTTRTDGKPVKITVTVWIEGWALLKNGGTVDKDVYTAAVGLTEEQFNEADPGTYYVLNDNVYSEAQAWAEDTTFYTKSTVQVPAENAIWDPAKTGNVAVQVGMTFDVGKNAFKSN